MENFIIDGNTKAERLVQINEIAKQKRPLCQVVSVLKSQNMEKEQLITMVFIEKDLHKDEKALKELMKDLKEKKQGAL